MPIPINVLIVEDTESDVQLIVRLLKKADYDVVFEQVETAEQMRAALEKRVWHIIISDYNLPQFDGRAALAALKETGLDIPFIIVSGMIGEETAVSMMKAGAQDFLMKGELARLVPAVERELEQAMVRRDRKHAEEQLLLQSSALNAAANAMVITDREGIIEWVNPAFNVLTGYALEEVVGKNPRELVKSDRHDRDFYQNLWNTILAGEVWRGELINRRKDGSLYAEEETITPLKNIDGTISYFIAIKQDISERKQAEESLSASEAELRALFASMQDVVLVIDRLGVYRKIAPTNPSLLVKPRAELLGSNLRDVFPAQQAEIFINAIQQVLNTKQTTHIEYELFIGDQTIWFETSISIMDKDNTLWVAHNVTARKQAEDALAASESKLRALVEQSPAVVYTESAQTKQTLYISPQIEKLTGYTSTEWTNDHNLWRRMVHAEDLATLVTEDERTNATYEPFHIEYRILTRDGRARWVRDEAVMIKNQDGTPLFWQGVLYDITERRQAEEALRESQLLYHSLVEVSPLSICRKDLAGRFTFANQRFLESSHITLADLVGKTDFDLHPPELAEEYQRDDQAVLNSGQVQEVVEEHVLIGGKLIFVQSIKAPIYDGSGKINGVQISFWDITARKQAEELATQQSEHLRLLYEASQQLNRTLDLHEIYQSVCDFMSTIAINDGLIISAFNPETQLITCRAYWMQNEWLDVSNFPSIPLEAEGKGTQSIAIRTGQALLINDFQTQVKTAQNSYTVDSQTNEVSKEIAPDEEEVTRSALIVPLKVGGKVTGVIQVTSYRLNAYTETQLKLLEALALHIAFAEQNALLYARVQTELEERTQTEKSLRGQEEQYRTLVEQLPAIVFIDDAKILGRTLYISPQVETILGFSPQEWLARSPGIWAAQAHPDDFERVQAGYMRCFLSGEPHDAEYRINASDGRMLWLRDHAVRLSDENGAPHLIHGLMYDITERKQAEEELRVSEGRYRELFNSMIDGFALHEIVYDDNGNPVDYRFLEVNPAYERLTGHQSINLIGKTMLEVAPGTDPYWIELLGNVAASGRSTFYENYSLELDRYFEVSAYCPKPGQFATIIVDITDRKRAEDALRESEEKYRLIAENTSDGIILFGADNRVQYVSPPYLKQLGYDQIEELNRTSDSIYSLIHPHDRDIIFSNIFEAIRLKKNGLIYSFRVKHKAGHYIWREDNAKFNYDSLGNYTGSHVICRDITERKQTEESIHQRVTELEMLYQSGLALNQLLDPKEIGQKILQLLEEKLNWQHTIIRLYHPREENLELLAFNQPGLDSEAKARIIEEHFNKLISKPGDGLSGWTIQQSQTIRSGDVQKNPHYIETYPGIRSGLYTPMKLNERMIGVIGAESEQPDAFSEADERLLTTLANQAASAFENARLFEETRQRVMELETLNRISLVLRAVSKQNEMLSIVLDEALAILNTTHGSIELHNKTTDTLDKIITRGWITNLTAPHPIRDGIAGKVFTSGEIYITHEFASDPETRAAVMGQIPFGWGGVCLPIRTTLQTLGVMIVSMPSEHELNKDEIRLLATLSEMTGAALQRMQLHEQTVRRLEQLRALRAVDQSIASSRDMRLTLNILLTHTLSQLGADAADVLLLQPGSNLLELAADQGFHTLLFESINFNNSISGRAILEHRAIMALDVESATLHENLQFEKFWKDENFACYWCVPLIVKGEVKGVLEVYRRTAFVPDAEWLEFLEAMAGQAAITIDTAQLFANLQHANLDLSLAYDATIEGWSRAMDLRDHETEGHTLRVTDLTVKLARAMRVSESQLTAIRRGSLLHDIGKMGVPDAILLKEGALTDEEWLLMRKHPQLAHDMLAPIAYLNDALNIPYCHHEKWDGTGYPQGLKGDHIPLVARIFAIVDVWDALTNDRAYRKKWTKQKARQYIKEQSGNHFDPQVVDVFLKNIGKN